MKTNYYVSFAILFAVAFSAVLNVQAQNLVMNPSFELNNACPDNSYVNLSYDFPPNDPTVQDWFLANEGTTDYYNVCANPDYLGIPSNWAGYQNARTGQGMAGIVYFIQSDLTIPGSSEYTEYLQGRLISPMVAGHVYYCSYWASLAENNAPSFPANNSDVIAIDKLGAHFSTNGIVGTGTSVLNLSADISSPAGVYYTDTLGWKKVSGFYTATGGEQWMTIGAFTPNASQSSVPVISNTGSFSSPMAYYYIDDVCAYDLNQNNRIQNHDTTICNGNGNTLNIHGNNNADTWKWNTGATTPSINATAGTFWVQSFGECEAWVDTFHIAINHTSLGNDTLVCGGQSIIIGPTADPAQTYLWNTGATSAQITANNAGVYVLTVNSPGCYPLTDTIKVAFAPKPPQLPDYDTLICTNQKGTFQIPVSGNGLIWHNTPNDEGSNQAPAIDKSNYGSFVYYVQQSDSCYGNLSEVKIDVLPQPYVQLNDTTICNSGNLIVLLGQPQPFVDFAWNTGADTCCINITQTGLYTLSASNKCGIAKGESQVLITSCDNCLQAPNAFSPNGDGMNDLYKVMYACAYHSFGLSIYNRYGQRVFFTTDSKSGWDGTFKGKICDVGTYFFYIEATLINPQGEKAILKGDLELVR